jgi:hypothetical protein
MGGFGSKGPMGPIGKRGPTGLSIYAYLSVAVPRQSVQAGNEFALGETFALGGNHIARDVAGRLLLSSGVFLVTYQTSVVNNQQGWEDFETVHLGLLLNGMPVPGSQAKLVLYDLYPDTLYRTTTIDASMFRESELSLVNLGSEYVDFIQTNLSVVRFN